MILIRKGMNGTVVGNVQQFLSENGYTIPQLELGSLIFGDGTFEAVRAFQASHLDSQGQPLVSDGVVGPETLWALQHPGEPSGDSQVYYTPGWFYHPDEVRADLRPVLDFACSKIGVHEEPDASNDGPLVRQFTVPGFIGDPWCALFASLAYAQLPSGSPFGREAATWGLYDWAVAHGRLLGAGDAVQPGDLLLILRGQRTDPKRHGHTMMACALLADGRIATVAGNESNAVRGGLRRRDVDISAVVRPVA